MCILNFDDLLVLCAGRGGGRGVAKSSMVEFLEKLAGEKMPRPSNTKLLNWRTSQVLDPPAAGGGVVTAEGGL